MSNGAWENRNIQSGAVLWLCHSFARAFSSDSEYLAICHCERPLECAAIKHIEHS